MINTNCLQFLVSGNADKIELAAGWEEFQVLRLCLILSEACTFVAIRPGCVYKAGPCSEIDAIDTIFLFT